MDKFLDNFLLLLGIGVLIILIGGIISGLMGCQGPSPQIMPQKLTLASVETVENQVDYIEFAKFAAVWLQKYEYDEFTFRACDGQDCSDPATVKIVNIWNLGELAKFVKSRRQ